MPKLFRRLVRKGVQNDPAAREKLFAKMYALGFIDQPKGICITCGQSCPHCKNDEGPA